MKDSGAATGRRGLNRNKMEHAGPVVLPLAVSDDAGLTAVAAFGAIVVLMAAVGPALYFTWHAVATQPS